MKRSTGRRLRSWWLVCASVTTMSLAVAACGNSEDSSSASSGGTGGKGSKDPVSIALLASSGASYSQAENKGAEAVAKAAGGSVTVFTADLDPQKQMTQCKDAIASGKYKGILIEAVSSAAAVPCAKLAAAAGIKVVGLSNPIGPKLQVPIQVPEVSGQVVQDHDKVGRTAGRMVKDVCKDKDPCQVVFMIAVPGFPASEAYKAGLNEEIESAPNIKIVQTYPTGYGDLSKAKAALQDALVKYPKLSVVTSDADWLGGAEQLVKDEGLTDQVTFIGTGGSRVGTDAVRSGAQYGDIPYLPRTTAGVATKMLIKAVRGEKLDEPAIDAVTLSPLGRIGIVKKTAETFKAQW
ncbi:sugar ABC transporter substrate-binding protein (plasmid) [Streptomyces sp. NBC_01450]|uniref:sugar ABC transporter substrate-binding protein n=1 Tax=Streptomyces sp. NBC_01450 TaxID=2903871 RepID=UPI002E34BD1F|nr:sugar ABC transporter substrate-binding protein [Streptomyces sp. NBC_01450]